MSKVIEFVKTRKQKELYTKFRSTYPDLKKQVVEWYPAGKEIVLYLKGGKAVSYDGSGIKDEGKWGLFDRT